MNFRGAQERMHQIAVDQGFNTTDVSKQFMHMVEEVGEAHNAWRMGKEDYPEELADIANNILRIATMTGIDLQSTVEAKQEKVAGRTYVRLPNGTLLKEEQRQPQ
jgi:NTP pyrophosphatase (non-canonical NTP hydrolase)